MKQKMFEIIIKADGGGGTYHAYTYYRIYKNITHARTKTTTREDEEIVRIKNVSKDYPISGHKLFSTLRKNGFGEIEANAIYNFLNDNYSNMI